jgi:dipeptidase D
MDMVCEKNNDTEFDFAKDALKLCIDGDFIKAEGTTLGGDNGIAVAYAMALMELKGFAHPAIEFVLTTDEEVGMGGAAALDSGLLSGRIFINLDSEEEGVLLTSCAGGVKADLTLGGRKTSAPAGFSPAVIRVFGLKGGHSGADIKLERANANRLIGRTLDGLERKFGIYLSDIGGGSKDNAIPREASGLIFCREADFKAISGYITEFETLLKNEYAVADPGLRLTIERTEAAGEVFEKEFLSRLITALMLLPYGVQSMSLDVDGLVESSNNIGVVSVCGEGVRIQNAVRSSSESKKRFVASQVRRVALAVSAEYDERGDYTGWQYDRDSKIRPVFRECYKKLYGREPVIYAIHAGLECGLFTEKLPGLDAISLGPNLYDVHTPDERMSIGSVARTWDFLLGVLAELR